MKKKKADRITKALRNAGFGAKLKVNEYYQTYISVGGQ